MCSIQQFSNSSWPFAWAKTWLLGLSFLLTSCGDADRIQQLEQSVADLESKVQRMEWDKSRKESEINALKSKLGYAESEATRLRFDLQNCNGKVNNARLGLPF